MGNLLGLRFMVSGLLAASVGLALAAGCSQRVPSAAQARVQQIVRPPDFVGSDACAPCHQNEYNSQHRSHHALTFHRMSRQSLGDLAPPSGPIPHSPLTMKEKNGRFGIGVASQSGNLPPLEYALGSGKTGMTYVTPLGSAAIAEMRMSYFPHQKRWYITPGHEKLPANSMGMVRTGAFARQCVLCHAVTIPADSLEPEERFFGVGCEACHGPGSAHIAAMSAGKYDQGQMAKLETWPASRINTLCGRCHLTEQDVRKKNLQKDATHRFQAYGLAQSRCFKQSKETLSCITCNDPHTNVSTNQKAYEAVCLNCHSGTPSSHRPAPLQSVAIKPCPVSPKEHCIGCHMPSRRLMAASQISVAMADHFIRVVRNRE